MDREVRDVVVGRKGDIRPEVALLVCPSTLGETSFSEEATLQPKAKPAASVCQAWKMETVRILYTG